MQQAVTADSNRLHKAIAAQQYSLELAPHKLSCLNGCPRRPFAWFARLSRAASGVGLLLMAAPARSPVPCPKLKAFLVFCCLRSQTSAGACSWRPPSGCCDHLMLWHQLLGLLASCPQAQEHARIDATTVALLWLGLVNHPCPMPFPGHPEQRTMMVRDNTTWKVPFCPTS